MHVRSRLRRCGRRQQKIFPHPETANFSANSAASTIVTGERVGRCLLAVLRQNWYDYEAGRLAW